MTSKAVYPSLEGRAALVTGGASGIGAAITRGLVRNKARVAVLDIDRAAGEALARETGALFLPCDLTDIPALKAAVAQVESRLGPIRALVNNAANDQRHKLGEVTEDDWDLSQNVNVRHQFFATQAVVPGMRDAGGRCGRQPVLGRLDVRLARHDPLHDRQGGHRRHDPLHGCGARPHGHPRQRRRPRRRDDGAPDAPLAHA
ncbi:Putative short-chain dehydrogenase/reductase, FabG-like protein [Rubellimicrobium mesophilum DSM 19309]|uniref:Putative short-chain dehydrogenase/reductase, FabG-like protein n=1 Tax=Rubellimicrobium mesophilum DSM 19309 TaxID=442562 RepID=A0A017HRV2_9RHOB|nr:Putative short-chain dehydrogenase/reductase, FabG-like protein [Rubellimicrobium mesophilum DSM 19309]